MTSANPNSAWNLQSFLDSLVFELDKARDTLAVKGVNRPLSYAVKDLSLDLQLFPEFDGNQVKFKTAKPGDRGASKVSISLGSITDRQIRETTKVSGDKDDLSLDEVEEIEPEVKESLKKIGVSSVRDIENLEARNIDLSKVTPGTKSNISELASRLKSLRNKKKKHRQLSVSQSNRKERPPKINSLQMSKSGEFAFLTLKGQHLARAKKFTPFATLNEVPVEIKEARNEKIVLRIPGAAFSSKANELKLALDPHAILKMNLQ